MGDEGKAASRRHRLAALLFVQTQKQLTTAGNVTGTSHFMQTFESAGLGDLPMTTSEPFDFSKYKRPQFEGPPRRARAAEREDDQMPTENLSELTAAANAAN